MALASTMLELGTPLPLLRLINAVDGALVDSAALTSASSTLVMFICNHCPYVVHVRGELVKLAHEAMEHGTRVFAINSNSIQTHPEDGPAEMRKLATSESWRFPFLYDEDQAVAKTFRAACTPDLFLFDGNAKLFYRGQLDDSRPKNDKPVTGRDLRDALERVWSGKPPPAEQRASLGCGIKWHPGNEPSYLSMR